MTKFNELTLPQKIRTLAAFQGHGSFLNILLNALRNENDAHHKKMILEHFNIIAL